MKFIRSSTKSLNMWAKSVGVFGQSADTIKTPIYKTPSPHTQTHKNAIIDYCTYEYILIDKRMSWCRCKCDGRLLSPNLINVY